MEISFPFPAFSRSGREILLPARISRYSFPVRELRSLTRTLKYLLHVKSAQEKFLPNFLHLQGHIGEQGRRLLHRTHSLQGHKTGGSHSRAGLKIRPRKVRTRPRAQIGMMIARVVLARCLSFLQFEEHLSRRGALRPRD